MGCDLRSVPLAMRRTYFNPRTHMGCDWETLTLTEERGKISIHAPTWGATPAGLCVSMLSISISIHAPTWGATVEYCKYDVDTAISIHAPTWGATRKDITIDSSLAISIHAPTWGATSLPLYDR